MDLYDKDYVKGLLRGDVNCVTCIYLKFDPGRAARCLSSGKELPEDRMCKYWKGFDLKSKPILARRQ